MIRLDVPYRSQWDNDAVTHSADCGPTCVAMMLNYYNVAMTPDRVYDFIASRPSHEFTNFTELIQVCGQHGVPLTYCRLESQAQALAYLHANLAAGNPSIVLVKYKPWRPVTGNAFDWGHFVVAVGYDDAGNILFHDPLFGLWQPRSRGSAFTLPADLFCAGWGGFPATENPNWACAFAGQLVRPDGPPPPPPPALALELVNFSSSLADYDQTPAGAAFNAVWDIRNTGQATWDAGYGPAFNPGPHSQTQGATIVNMAAQERFALGDVGDRNQVGPGEQVRITLPLTAPTQPGVYGYHWRMQTAAGGAFGSTRWLKITVVPGPEPKPEPTEPLALTPAAQRRILALAAYRWAATPNLEDPAEAQLWLENLGDWGEQTALHVVGPGDTLVALAKKYYGESWRWKTLEVFNNLNPQRGLWAGDRLEIPLHGSSGAQDNPDLPHDEVSFDIPVDPAPEETNPVAPALDYNVIGENTAGMGFVADGG